MPMRMTQPPPRRWRNHPRQKRSRRRPTLRFSPTAWAKLLFLRDRGPTEIGAFGVASSDDLLHVEDITLVLQNCTEASVLFDDMAVADFFEEQVDLGRVPEQFARIWIHTHPDESADPSVIDDQTFRRVFGHCDWAVMFIIASGGATFAELHWRHGGPAAIRMDVDIEYSDSFPASDELSWDAEYEAKVRYDAARETTVDQHRRSRAEQDRNTNSALNQNPPFIDDSLANFCRKPLVWEMG